MQSEYVVVGYIKEAPGTFFKKNSVSGGPFHGMPFSEAEKIAKDLTVNDFRPGLSSLGKVVRIEDHKEAPLIVNN